MFSFEPAQVSKAGRTFFISLRIASHQKVFPFSSSKRRGSSTVFGILIPNLCVRIQYLDLIFAITLFRFLWV